MRQITVFGSTSVGGLITVEHEPERQIKRTIKAAKKLLHSNGLWPPEPRHLEESTGWQFDLAAAVELEKQIDRLQSLL